MTLFWDDPDDSREVFHGERNTKNNFSENAEYRPDAEIVITYHDWSNQKPSKTC